MSIEVIGSSKYDADLIIMGAALKTDDIEATHARLVESVAVSECAKAASPAPVCTVKSHCLDVPTLLVQHLRADAANTSIVVNSARRV